MRLHQAKGTPVCAETCMPPETHLLSQGSESHPAGSRQRLQAGQDSLRAPSYWSHSFNQTLEASPARQPSHPSDPMAIRPQQICTSLLRPGGAWSCQPLAHPHSCESSPKRSWSTPPSSATLFLEVTAWSTPPEHCPCSLENSYSFLSAQLQSSLQGPPPISTEAAAPPLAS